MHESGTAACGLGVFWKGCMKYWTGIYMPVFLFQYCIIAGEQKRSKEGILVDAMLGGVWEMNGLNNLTGKLLELETRN